MLVIRARSSLSFTKILKSINSNEGTLSLEAERSLRRSISRLRPGLLLSLRTRVGHDSNATVRKAAVNAYIELILMDINGLENGAIGITRDDVSILSNICNDSSTSVRKVVIEAIATLLQKQHYFKGHFLDPGLLEYLHLLRNLSNGIVNYLNKK